MKRRRLPQNAASERFSFLQPGVAIAGLNLAFGLPRPISWPCQRIGSLSDWQPASSGRDELISYRLATFHGHAIGEVVGELQR